MSPVDSNLQQDRRPLSIGFRRKPYPMRITKSRKCQGRGVPRFANPRIPKLIQVKEHPPDSRFKISFLIRITNHDSRTRRSGIPLSCRDEADSRKPLLTQVKEHPPDSRFKISFLFRITIHDSRNLENVRARACRDEADSRIPKLTQTIKQAKDSIS